jgi:hypothetical protein
MIIQTDRDPSEILALLKEVIDLNHNMGTVYREEGRESVAKRCADHVMEYTAWFNIINNAWCRGS